MVNKPIGNNLYIDGICGGPLKTIILPDFTPLSLGVETFGGTFTKLIEKNTKVPTKKSAAFSTSNNNQTQVDIKIYQGERNMASDNKFLGELNLVGLSSERHERSQIEVTFDIDAVHIMRVNAKDKTTGKNQTIKVVTSGMFDKDTVHMHQGEEEASIQLDKQTKHIAEMKNNPDICALILQPEHELIENKDNIDGEFFTDATQKINEL